MIARSLVRRKPKAVRRLLSVTLAVLLLAAELLAVTHPLDAAAHSGPEPCKICLSIGGFDAVAVPADSAPVLATAAAVTPPWLDPAEVALRRATPVARGPPALS